VLYLPYKHEGRSVAAIITYPNGTILLERRETVPFKGLWGLPGGKVDSGETLEEAVIREVMEETGLIVKVMSKIGSYIEAGLEDSIKYNYYATCFHVAPIAGKIKAQKGEISELKLFSLEDVPNKLAFRHKEMLCDFIKK